MEGERFLLTATAWTMVAFNASSAVLVVEGGFTIRAHVGGEEAPPIDATHHFPVRGLGIVRGIALFAALWLRADRPGQVPVTVYKGNSMSGIVFFGTSPFRLQGPGLTEISLPFEPQTLDGGTPATDHTGLAVIDCGSPTTTTVVRTIDGRLEGDLP